MIEDDQDPQLSQNEHQHTYFHDNDEHNHTNNPSPTNNGAFVGDILEENKPEKVTRIYTQNLNGIKWDKDGGNWPQICETMAAIHSDISCFTELNQDINSYSISTQMHQIEQRFFQHSKFGGSTDGGAGLDSVQGKH